MQLWGGRAGPPPLHPPPPSHEPNIPFKLCAMKIIKPLNAPNPFKPLREEGERRKTGIFPAPLHGAHTLPHLGIPPLSSSSSCLLSFTPVDISMGLHSTWDNDFGNCTIISGVSSLHFCLAQKGLGKPIRSQYSGAPALHWDDFPLLPALGLPKSTPGKGRRREL